MVDAVSELDEKVATEYFRQYENIVRGRCRKKCVEDFILGCESVSESSSFLSQAQLERLVESLNEAGDVFIAATNDPPKQSKSVNTRSLIYCFIGSLVCVLLLHYA